MGWAEARIFWDGVGIQKHTKKSDFWPSDGWTRKKEKENM